MKSFFQRVLPGVFGGEPDRRKPVPTAAPAGGFPGMPPDGAAALSALAAVGARRPLISVGGEVVGFEFRIGAELQRRLKRRSDLPAQAAYVSAVLTSARLIAQTGRIGFARVPADWLAHGADTEVCKGVMVSAEIALAVELEPEALQAAAQAALRLRAAGAKLGWDAVSGMGPGMTPDFMLLRQDQSPMITLLEAAKTWPPALRGLPALATDIVNVEDLELALNSGVSYVCGALAPKAGEGESRDTVPVTPEVRRVGHLLNQLVMGAETAVIVSEIKGDVGLSYRLLRRINTASFAQLNAGASIDQAVLVLGRNELYRWLSMLLVQYAGSRKVSSALQEVALWRSRLLELLAMEKNEESPSQFFTLGLASMLGLILKMSLTDVVSTLNLPAHAQQALLEQAGPWHAYLQMAMRVEAQTLDGADAQAEPFGGTARVLELSDQAWAWAAEHTDRGDGPVNKSKGRQSELLRD